MGVVVEAGEEGCAVREGDVAVGVGRGVAVEVVVVLGGGEWE